MTQKLETLGGEHIRECIAKAVALAIHNGTPVEFDFNGHTYRAEPTDSYDQAKARAEIIFGHPILTADEEHVHLTADMARREGETASAIATANVPTEAQLRDAEAPWPKTAEELSAYIAALVDRPHDYGTCVYAMSLSAVAAFQYVASVLGCTGFQASCADMDIMKRTRRMKGPFLIIDGANLLYPQHDVRERLEEFIEKSRSWATDEAKKLLAESSAFTHPKVRAHWEALANFSSLNQEAAMEGEHKGAVEQEAPAVPDPPAPSDHGDGATSEPKAEDDGA